MRRVVINGRSYAVGLDWFPLKKMTRAEVIQEADRYDGKCDLVVMLREQYALARSGKKTWKKTRSLAASLVQAGYPDAVHAFALTDADTNEVFWWVVGIRKGIISGQTDRCFDSLDAAEAVSVTVQDSFGVPELESFPESAGPEFLAAHVGQPKKTGIGDSTALTPLKETATVKLLKAALVGAGLGLGWWAVASILDYRAAREALEQARILTQNKERRGRELAEHPEKYFPSEWMKAPTADAFMDQCAPAMFRFPTAANGWELAGLSCSGNLSATWRQTALSDYMHLPFNAVLDAKKPKLAVSGKTLPALPVGERNVPMLLSQADAARRLYALTQHFRLHLEKLSFGKRQIRTIEKIQLSCPWLKATWELSDVPAFLIADYAGLGKALAEIPGLIVTEVSYSKKDWIIRGELYAK